MSDYLPLGTNEKDSADRGMPIPQAGSRYNKLNQCGPFASQFWADAQAADDDYILPALTDTGVEQVLTTGFAQPDVPRCLSATPGGTSGDIADISVTVEGTDIDDQPITEVLPVFTENATTAVVGLKAFKTITRITIPAHDGTGATTKIGILDKLGLDRILNRGNTVLRGTMDGVAEATAATVTFDTDELCKNTVDPNTALNGARDYEVFWIDAPPRS